MHKNNGEIVHKDKKWGKSWDEKKIVEGEIEGYCSPRNDISHFQPSKSTSLPVRVLITSKLLSRSSEGLPNAGDTIFDVFLF